MSEIPLDGPILESELADEIDRRFVELVESEEERQKRKQEENRKIAWINRNLAGKLIKIREIPGVIGAGVYSFGGVDILAAEEVFVKLRIPPTPENTEEKIIEIPIQKFHGAFEGTTTPSASAEVNPSATNIFDSKKP